MKTLIKYKLANKATLELRPLEKEATITFSDGTKKIHKLSVAEEIDAPVLEVRLD